MLTGYAHPAYPASLSGQRAPIDLPGSGGFLVPREIGGTGMVDAIAPYPFLVCRDWSALPADIAAIPRDIVSVTAVTDPFAEVGEQDLARAFTHSVRPYKPHLVIDLTRPLDEFADPHHLGCARRALKKLEVERCPNPLDWMADWSRLYGNLAERHRIRGPALMDDGVFARQLLVPGLTMFRAAFEGRTLGMILTMHSDDTAWFHLGAYDAQGYRRNASYALVFEAIRFHAEAGRRRISIGGGSGAFAAENDGLLQFKRGWASSERMTYLCAHVVDRPAYDALNRTVAGADERYFPPYRAAASL